MDAAESNLTGHDANRDDPLVRFRPGLVLCALIFVAANLGGYRSLNPHEILAAVPARAMLAGGDWIVPDLGGVPRLEKPPLVYWQIAATGWLWGAVDEFSVRLPQLVSAIALAVLVGAWGAREWGRDTGWVIGIVQLTTLGSLTYARQGVVEMTLILLTTSALWLAAWQPANQTWRAGQMRWIGIYALLGISMLAKFHYGPVMVLAPCVIWWCVERRWGEFRHLVNPIGWVLMLGPLVLWCLAVRAEVPQAGAVWWTETVGRATGEMVPRSIWPFLPAPLFLALPWSVFLLLEIPRSWKQLRDPAASRARFYWCWIGVQAAIVLLQPNKHATYFLALLPACSLLAGRNLAGHLRRIEWSGIVRTSGQARTGMLICGGAGIAFAAWCAAMRPEVKSFAIVAGGLFSVGTSIALLQQRFGRVRAAWTITLVSASAVVFVAIEMVLPAWDSRQGTVEFCHRVWTLAPDEQLICLGERGTPLFSLGANTIFCEDAAELASRLPETERLLVLARDEAAFQLAGLGDARRLSSMSPEECRGLTAAEMVSLWEVQRKVAPDVPIESAPRRMRIVLPGDRVQY